MPDLPEVITPGADTGHDEAHEELHRRHNAPSVRTSATPAADFDTAGVGAWEDVGLSIARTPAEDETATVLARLKARTSDGSPVRLRVNVSPAPAGGSTNIEVLDEEPGTAKYTTLAGVDAIDLASGVAYTIKVQAYHSGAGTTRLEAAESRLTLVIVPR